MSTRRVLLSVAVVVMFGCAEKREAAPQTERPAAVAEQSPAVEEVAKPAEAKPDDRSVRKPERGVDPFYVLDRLREATKSIGPEWAIATSPLTWSTLTVVPGARLPPNAADLVWAKWREPKTALTLEANQEIKTNIETAVSEVTNKDARVERTFQTLGFDFVVVASNRSLPDMTFVRISFKCVDY